MIAKLMVAVCDICGHTEPAKYVMDCRTARKSLMSNTDKRRKAYARFPW